MALETSCPVTSKIPTLDVGWKRAAYELAAYSAAVPELSASRPTAAEMAEIGETPGARAHGRKPMLPMTKSEAELVDADNETKQRDTDVDNASIASAAAGAQEPHAEPGFVANRSPMHKDPNVLPILAEHAQVFQNISPGNLSDRGTLHTIPLVDPNFLTSLLAEPQETTELMKRQVN